MATIADSKDIPEQGQLAPASDSFALLSKPTAELTFEDMVTIAADLRAKRVQFLKGVADRPGGTARKAVPKPTAEEKAARTEHLKTQLSLGGLKF